jgi:response regulator RpfG family c-di-GMP phosphodiesterase
MMPVQKIIAPTFFFVYNATMHVAVRVKDLRVGMYVTLPASWFKHPFLRGTFLITSPEQVDAIRDSGFDKVLIDTAKGSGPAAAGSTSGIGSTMVPPRTWEPEKLVPVELREAIRDRSLPPEKKSQIVYRSSLQLMERLLEDPKVENIKASKQGIAEIVDLIVADDATSRHLLRITSHDFNTYTHSVNVGVLSVLLVKTLVKGSDAHDLHEVGAGLFLHDIGKVRIDPAILNKPGLLTAEEKHIIREHPRHGYDILAETDQLSEECRIIVMQHHERENGTGYPFGLKGDDIHLYGRICRLADVYDSLTSERAYRQRLTTFEALKHMQGELSGNFQKALFEEFVLLFA